MEAPSAGKSFTHHDEEDFARSWAPFVRQFIKYLGQSCAKDPDNKSKYGWSDQNVDHVQTLCDSVFFYHLLCYYLGDESRSQKDKFATTRKRNALPSTVVDEYVKQNFSEQKSSTSKNRKRSTSKGGRGQAASTNAKSSGKVLKQNPYPDPGNTSPANPPPTQPPPDRNTMVPNTGYPPTTNGAIAVGPLCPSPHSVEQSRANPHIGQHADLEAASGRLLVPKANPPGELRAQAWSGSGQEPVSMMHYTTSDRTQLSTTPGPSSEYSGNQQRTWITNELGQTNTVYNPPGETGPHSSQSIAAGPSSFPGSSHIPASNSSQSAHILPTAMSHMLPWASTSSHRSDTLVAPTPTQGPSHRASTEIVPAVGTYHQYHQHHQQQQAHPSSPFTLQNLTPTPSPSSTSPLGILAANPWDAGTTLSPPGTPTPQDIDHSSGLPAISVVTAEDDVAARESQLFRYPSNIFDPPVQMPGSDPFSSSVPPVGNTQRLDPWNNGSQGFTNFLPGGTNGATSGGTSNQATYEPPFAEDRSGTHANQYMSGGHSAADYLRLMANQRDNDPGVNQKRKRDNEGTGRNDASTSSEAQAALLLLNHKRRKQDA